MTQEAPITIETKYTGPFGLTRPARGNDALFEIARRYFTKDDSTTTASAPRNRRDRYCAAGYPSSTAV